MPGDWPQGSLVTPSIRSTVDIWGCSVKNGEAVTIKKIGNGYIVEPACSDKETFGAESILAFQDMGYASTARDNQLIEQTLLGFIEKHFRGKA